MTQIDADEPQRNVERFFTQRREGAKERKFIMRKLMCFQMSGMIVQELLDAFNEWANEFKVTEGDVVSVSTSSPTLGVKVHTSTGSKEPKVEVTIVYWSAE